LAHFEGDSARDDFEDFDSSHAMTIQDLEGNQLTAQASTLAAGKGGCVVLLPMAGPKLFLDQQPGLLLSLLGTQVVAR
jgi:hypothetical protein